MPFLPPNQQRQSTEGNYTVLVPIVAEFTVVNKPNPFSTSVLQTQANSQLRCTLLHSAH